MKPQLESYRLGIDDIDSQHYALFETIDNLDVSVANGDCWLVVHTTMAELERRVKEHFSVEESLMRICHYPHVQQHIDEHAVFADTVQQMKQQSLTEDIPREASQFLRDWLTQHLLTEDRKYAEHFLAVSERFLLAF